jgi:Flp pilus assembly protein TadB
LASAEKLLREAQFAFQSISPGATDERKNTARAKRLAGRIVKKYPNSSEASQAYSILRQLDVRTEPRQSRNLVHTHATSEPPHAAHDLASPVKNAETNLARAKQRTNERTRETEKTFDEPGWQDILQKAFGLSANKAFVATAMAAFFVIILIGLIGSLPLLIFGFAYYAFQPRVFRKHVYRLLDLLS